MNRSPRPGQPERDESELHGCIDGCTQRAFEEKLGFGPSLLLLLSW